VPPRHDVVSRSDTGDPLDRFQIPGRPEPPAGRGGRLRAAATVVAVGLALLVAPRLIGTGVRPRLIGDAAPAAVEVPTVGRPGAGAPPGTTRAPRTTAAPDSSRPPARQPATPPTGSRARLPAGLPAGPSAPPATAAYDRQILALVNSARSGNGCGALALDSRLQAAAREHTRDMAGSGRFSHTGTDASTPFQRAAAHGFTGAVGENIARGYETPRAVMNAWMASPGHRANILNCDFRLLGVGYVAGGSWWTEIFGG